MKQKQTNKDIQSNQQLSLFSAQTGGAWKIIATNQRLREAWEWLRAEINDRPLSCDPLCRFDHKLWGVDKRTPLQAVSPFVDHTATLYLLTELGDLQQAIDLAHGKRTVDLEIEQVDPDCQSLLTTPDRFRASLSEHLSFWVTLALEARDERVRAYARSRPNLKPERQGPDGVTISIFDDTGEDSVVRVHSVKNSVRSPKSLVSTAKLRNNKTAGSSKVLLDEFWFISKLGRSLNELDESLSGVCNLLQLSAEKKMRMALLHKCIYDATVVANDSHASVDLFEGYQFVVDDVGRRTATFIGADDWRAFSEATRLGVTRMLNSAGALV